MQEKKWVIAMKKRKIKDISNSNESLKHQFAILIARLQEDEVISTEVAQDLNYIISDYIDSMSKPEVFSPSLMNILESEEYDFDED